MTAQLDDLQKGERRPYCESCLNCCWRPRRFMWSSDASRRDFLTKTPDGTHYLIASHSAFAEDEARCCSQWADMPASLCRPIASHIA